MEVAASETSKYGVIVPDEGGEGITGLVEKPNPDEAPSTLVSIGRYLLTPDIFETLRKLPSGNDSEIQLADAINVHAETGEVEGVRLNGRRFDCGSTKGFLEASMHEYTKRMAFENINNKG